VSPPYALKNRSLLSLDELSARDVELLLELARSLKRDNAEGQEQQLLRGLHIATLAAADAVPGGDCLETAATQQGAMVVRVGQEPAQQLDSGDRHGLPGLLGRLYDAVEVRGMTRARLNDFASHCNVPVYRDLSHAAHPARVVADLMTMRERAAKPLDHISVAWLGDPRSERGATLMHGALLMGLDLRLVAPRDSWPTEEAIERLRALARSHGSHLSLHESASAALEGCDFCYGDRHAKPLRSARVEPTLLHIDRGNLDAVRDPVQANQLHAVKAMLVATLA
jgi:ornithine carbamoyltransferase